MELSASPAKGREGRQERDEKKMKRILTMVLWGTLCVFLPLSLCACGGRAPAESDASADPESGEAVWQEQELQETAEPPAASELPAASEPPAATERPAQSPAPAENDADTIQFQLGSSGFAMEVPHAYRNGDVTVDELKSNLIAYYYSPYSEMDFDIYQFPKPDPELSLEAYVRRSAEDFNGSDVRMRELKGIAVGSYKSREVYDGVEYDVLVALMEEGEEYVEVVFWLDGEDAEAKAEAILNSLSYVETYDLQLGDSPFYLTIPTGYVMGEVTEADIADDLVGYYYSDSSPLDFDVYQFSKEGNTLEKYAIEEANLYEAERVDYRTVNGIQMAFYYSYEEDEGEMYTVANYLFEYDDEFMEISFWLDGEIAVKQTDRILSTLKRVDA